MQIMMREFYLSINRVVVDVSFDEPHGGDNPIRNQRPLGIYSKLGNDAVGLFVIDRKLYLYLNGHASEVLGKGITAKWYSEGKNRQLSIVIGQSRKTIAYKDPGPPVSTPFYAEEEQDVDFGLWLANVLSSTESRERFTKTWSQA